jgi:crotonobetainyl-CoA:carnitine CoA-transferase CaiB-like acyl-CoA transferase
MAGPNRVFSDARFATPELRRASDAALAAELEGLFARRDSSEWQRLSLPLGLGCVRADLSVAQFLLDDPHAREEQLAPEVHHPRFGPMRRWGPLVICDDGPGQLEAGALAGDHSDALLREIGRSEEQIAALRAARVVASEPV